MSVRKLPEPPTLEGVLAFVVDTEECDPHDAGPLHVVIDGEGILLRWLGDDSRRWALTWKELRHTHDYVRETGTMERTVELLRDEIESLRLALEAESGKKQGILVPFPK